MFMRNSGGDYNNYKVITATVTSAGPSPNLDHLDRSGRSGQPNPNTTHAAMLF